MLRGADRLASGSSFLWAFDGRTFLVTNWHNLSGRNPLTNELMSRIGAIPDRISFGMFKQVSEPDANGLGPPHLREGRTCQLREGTPRCGQPLRTQRRKSQCGPCFQFTRVSRASLVPAPFLFI